MGRWVERGGSTAGTPTSSGSPPSLSRGDQDLKETAPASTGATEERAVGPEVGGHFTFASPSSPGASHDCY